MAKTPKIRNLKEIGRQCFCLQSRMAARAITRRYNSILAAIGLGVTEFSLLAALTLGEDLSITDLADRLAFERTTLVRNLKGMADRGLIKQADDQGRSVHYVLTTRGNHRLNAALPLWTKAQASIDRRLEGHTARSVLASLKALRRTTSARG